MSEFNVKKYVKCICEDFSKRGLSTSIISDNVMINMAEIHLVYEGKYLGNYEILVSNISEYDAEVEVWFSYVNNKRHSLLCFGVRSGVAWNAIIKHLDNLLKEVNRIK